LDVGEGRDTDLEVGRVCEWRGEEEEEEEDVGFSNKLVPMTLIATH
jgi:hypothetical protein